MIKEGWLEDGHMHYEHIYGHRHHCHMRCIRCGNVIEFVEEALEDIERRLCEENDFQIIDHRMDIVDYCSNCKKEV